MIGQMPNIQSIQSTRWVYRRRSQRVVLCLPVVIRDQSEGDEPPCVETTHTLVVNAHGALIVLTMRVRLTQRLVLQNLTSRKEQSCRVVHVGERRSNFSEIGVEFTEPTPHFWNIDFPPTDWQPRLD
jgi:hypothetical protein